MKPDDGAGGMARRDDMTSFCAKYRIPSITIRQMQVRRTSLTPQRLSQSRATGRATVQLNHEDFCTMAQVYARHQGEGEIAPKANQPTYAQLPEAAAPPVATAELGK